MFLSYLLVDRMVQRLPTVYRLDDDRCYLFPSDGDCRRVTIDDAMDMEDEKLLLLTDAQINWTGPWKASSRTWRVIFAASPRTIMQSKSWSKERGKRTIFMATWGWQELVGAFRYYPYES